MQKLNFTLSTQYLHSEDFIKKLCIQCAQFCKNYWINWAGMAENAFQNLLLQIGWSGNVKMSYWAFVYGIGTNESMLIALTLRPMTNMLDM